MQRYGVNNNVTTGDFKNVQSCQNVSHIFKKYPDLLTSLNGNDKRYTSNKLKCEGRVLRRDTERMKKMRRFKKQPNYRLKQFENAFFQAMDHRAGLFNCPICRNVLQSPVTVACGHTFCNGCLDDSYEKCIECAMDLKGRNNVQCVNVLVQALVEKWRERNRHNDMGGLPDTTDILGMEPRYHLRSGYAGLKIYKNDTDTISNTSRKRILEDNRNITSHSPKLFKSSYLLDTKENSENFQTTLENVFREVDDIKEQALKSSWNCILPTDFECILCSRCILDPVTTECGHTFCRECLTRVLDHKLSCPLCMASLEVADYSKGSTVILDAAIRFLVPDEFQERMKISLKESLILERSSDVGLNVNISSNLNLLASCNKVTLMWVPGHKEVEGNKMGIAFMGEFKIPLFVCTNAFPGVACPLYVSEPRYRLLTRRSLLSSTKRFAMAWNKFVEYGTVLEVKDAVSLEDGRFILSTVGVRRYRVISRGEQDGYDTAKVQYIKDNAVPLEKLPELVSLHQQVYNKAAKWIKCLSPKDQAEVERLIGKMPNVEKDWYNSPDGPSWTWWLMPIISPPCSQLQVGFLSTTNLEKRLRAIDKMVDHMKIRMKALSREAVTCSPKEENSETCEDTERDF